MGQRMNQEWNLKCAQNSFQHMENDMEDDTRNLIRPPYISYFWYIYIKVTKKKPCKEYIDY